VTTVLIFLNEPLQVTLMLTNAFYLLSLFWRLVHMTQQLSPRALRERFAVSRRRKFDLEAQWYRLRYDDPELLQQALAALADTGGRLALRLRHESGGLVALWLGVPRRYAVAIKEMQARFAFSAMPGTVSRPFAGRFNPAGALPNDQDCDAYLAGGRLFILPAAAAGDGRQGEFFPYGSNSEWQAWSLPQPVLGLSKSVLLDLPAGLPLRRAPGQWCLGWDQQGRSVGGRQVGVLGQKGAAEEWIETLVKASAGRVGRLVLFDGVGRLAARLALTPRIARMRIEGTAAVMNASQPEHSSFNPLVWSENMTLTAARWFWWFRAMGVADSAARRIADEAIHDGVGNMIDLVYWLNQREHQSAPAELLVFIGRLLDEEMRRWMANPDHECDPRVLVDNGTLIVSLPGLTIPGDLKPEEKATAQQQRWQQQQAFRALLALMIEARANVVFYGIPLEKVDVDLLNRTGIRYVAGGLVSETNVVTRCTQSQADKIVSRFLCHHQPLTMEHLQLLPPRSAIIARNGSAAAVSWQKIT
jgi:hypothetical protein